MAGRPDPPHERVTLSLDELCTLARLEESFGEKPAREQGGHEGGQKRRLGRWRRRMSAGCLKAMRLGPWLVPVGIVVMLAALSWSVPVTVVGAALAVVGFSTCLWRLRLRTTIARLGGRRRR